MKKESKIQKNQKNKKNSGDIKIIKNNWNNCFQKLPLCYIEET